MYRVPRDYNVEIINYSKFCSTRMSFIGACLWCVVQSKQEAIILINSNYVKILSCQ
jgi:hypothetical protein